MTTEFDDSLHWGFFLTGTTLDSSTGKYVRMSSLVLSALRAAGVFSTMEDGTTAPATDKLWLDKNTDPPTLKEWDATGSSWVPMTFDRLFGRATVGTLTVTGGTANAVVVSQPAGFQSNRLYLVTPTGTNTTTTTIQVSGVGTFGVKYSDGSNIVAGEFTASRQALLLFTGSRFEIVIPVADINNAATAAAASAAAAAASAASAVPFSQATKSGAYTAVGGDNNATHRFTDAGTISLTAAATLGGSWRYRVVAAGGDRVIDPNGSETINGASTFTIPNGYSSFIWCTGTAFFATSDFLKTEEKTTPAYVQSEIAKIPLAQCHLDFVSTTQIKLSRFNGSLLAINGANQTIPSAGVTISNGSLSSNTLYYVYARMVSTTMELVLSTTGYSVDTTTGLPRRSDDAAQTLVGMVRTNSSSQFADGVTQRFVRSWFNRRRVLGTNNQTSDVTTTSGSFVALSSTHLRCEFLSWASETIKAIYTGNPSIGSDSQFIYTSLGLDGTRTGSIARHQRGTISIFADVNTHAVNLYAAPAEGYHYIDVFGSVSGGTGTWPTSSASAGGLMMVEVE